MKNFAICISIFSFLFSFAEVNSAEAIASAPSVPSKNVETVPGQDSGIKLAVLEKELETYKDFTQHILATVYFSIGTVVVVLFAMVGFGWYQNIRAYERDKESLHRTLSSEISAIVTVAEAQLNEKITARLKHFDENIGAALENTFQAISDLRLVSQSDNFRTTHNEGVNKTPRTDMMVLVGHLEQAIGKVSPNALNHALGVMVEYLETVDKIDCRQQWLSIVERLPVECAGYAARLTEILSLSKTRG